MHAKHSEQSYGSGPSGQNWMFSGSDLTYQLYEKELQQITTDFLKYLPYFSRIITTTTRLTEKNVTQSFSDA